MVHVELNNSYCMHRYIKLRTMGSDNKIWTTYIGNVFVLFFKMLDWTSFDCENLEVIKNWLTVSTLCLCYC